MKIISIIGIISVVAIIAVSVADFGLFNASSPSTTSTTGSSLQPLPPAKGYLGASFVAGKSYSLVPFNGSVLTGVNPEIPQSSQNGSFDFTFSASDYNQSAFSVKESLCTGPASCSEAVILSFSYGSATNGDYALATSGVSLPCGNLATAGGGTVIPTAYLFVTFGVNTLGVPGAATYDYQYVAYANCSNSSTNSSFSSEVTSVVSSVVSSVTTSVSSMSTVNSSFPPLPAAKGYLGASFHAGGTSYPLSLQSSISTNGSNANIPDSANTGYLTFSFSTLAYNKSDITVLVQSCSSNVSTTQQTVTNVSGSVSGVGSENASGQYSSGRECQTVSHLGFSYGANNQGDYVVTTGNISLPCERNQANSEMNYLLVWFGVNTIGEPSAVPYFYVYVLYANC